MTVTIDRIECWVHRAPIDVPVANAFGAMSNRPALWLRLTDSDGGSGWGEVFCNFPQVGAEHRARLIDSLFVPLLKGLEASDPAPVRAHLERRTHRMAIQCGEPGPFAQIIGAVDQAMWDLCARRAGQPVWRYAGGGRACVRPYASGIGPDGVAETVRARWQQGYRAFKLKLGFGLERDLANLAEMRSVIGPDTPLMCDANQAWDLSEARAMLEAIEVFKPFWVEEPLAADRPLSEWRELAASSPLALAAGENIRGEGDFLAMLDAGCLRFVQPDVGKWGGLSGGLQIARRARALGVAYCPHWLAGGLGLAASMHALAASGDTQGWAEVDANPNPLRESIFPFQIQDGLVTLGDAPGFGLEPDLEACRAWRIDHHRVG